MFHMSRARDVLIPKDWGAVPCDDWSHTCLYFTLEGTEVTLSPEDHGWQVSVEGDMPEERAARLAQAISDQVQAETGVATTVVPI